MKLIELLEESYESKRWTHGECGTFAAALHQRFGWPIFAVVERSINPDNWSPSDYDVIHAFCKVGGLAADADGITRMFKLGDVTGDTAAAGREFAIIPMTLQELDENRSHLEDVEDTKEALDYIEHHLDLFLKQGE